MDWKKFRLWTWDRNRSETAPVKQAALSSEEDRLFPSYDGGFVAPSGTWVSVDTGMVLAPFYQGVRVIAEQIAMLPLEFLRPRKDGRGNEQVVGSFAERALERPYGTMTRQKFIELTVTRAILYPHAYAEIRVTSRGRTILRPLYPQWVQKVDELEEDGSLRVHLAEPRKPPRTLVVGEFFRVEGFGLTNTAGSEVIRYGANTLGRATEVNQYASSYFTQGGAGTTYFMPKGETVLEDEIVRKVSEALQKGGRASYHTDRLLHVALDTATTERKSAKDSLLIEAQEAIVREVARLLNIHPSFLMAEGTSTFASEVERSRQLKQITLLPWLARFEGAIKMYLIAEGDPMFARFNTDELDRGDMSARASRAALLVGARVLTPNEAREEEGYNPVDGGDTLQQAPGAPPQFPSEPPARSKPKPARPTKKGDDPEARAAAGSSAHHEALIAAAVDRAARRELGELAKKATAMATDQEAWKRWLPTFYGKHVEFLTATLQVEPAAALAYCLARQERLAQGVAAAGGEDELRGLLRALVPVPSNLNSGETRKEEVAA